VALSGRDRTRYARHLLLTQLGEAGQERLLAAQVVANGDADAGALAVARRYLTRAGVKVSDGTLDDSSSARPSGTDEPRAPETNEPPGSEARAPAPLRVATAEQVASMAAHPSLREAARALAGALSAVNTLQSLIGAEGATLSGAPVQHQIFFAISSEEA
jgi:hypothetical protein